LQEAAGPAYSARLVNPTGVGLGERLSELRRRIEAAASRSGRVPGSITLIGVTKTVPAESIAEAVSLGLADLGENRVQEAEAHQDVVGRERARWHLIGHLQRNKAGRAVERFDRLHGVDDLGIAEAVSRRAEALGRRVPVLVEVNVSGEATKFGVRPGEAIALIERVASLPGLALDGLMTVGAPFERPDEARPGFAALRALRDRAEQATGVALPELSMGMSGDFEVAIEEGSTMIRVGTALFGARG
jgi:pyridoxal phosphate enzyme (YggS family)